MHADEDRLHHAGSALLAVLFSIAWLCPEDSQVPVAT
jgi:hypothetical protein